MKQILIILSVNLLFTESLVINKITERLININRKIECDVHKFGNVLYKHDHYHDPCAESSNSPPSSIDGNHQEQTTVTVNIDEDNWSSSTADIRQTSESSTKSDTKAEIYYSTTENVQTTKGSYNELTTTENLNEKISTKSIDDSASSSFAQEDNKYQTTESQINNIKLTTPEKIDIMYFPDNIDTTTTNPDADSEGIHFPEDKKHAENKSTTTGKPEIVTVPSGRQIISGSCAAGFQDDGTGHCRQAF